jgi:N-acetylmuramoyl-L-alanine amidase
MLGADTVRIPWPVQLALLDTLPVDVELAADTSRRNRATVTIGRAGPGAAYSWFFPAGTRATVSGRINDDLRLRLSPTSLAWIPQGDASPLPRGLPAITGVVGATRLQADVDRVTVRIPLSQRIPFRVTESDRSLTVRLYGAVGNLSWLQYGPADSLVRRLSWSQESSGEVDVLIELGAPVWGYRARFDRNDLLIEVRRPPAIDLDHPFRGRLIVLDPGHPPLGAKGPTGLREDEVTLAVAKRLKPMLEAAGARVLLTRSDERPVDLASRVRFADSVGAELLLSIHNNGLPDGVNPFRNNGTSVYYNQPRSLVLARQLQQALVERIGLTDLGVGRGDLALVRPTWMPSALAEGYFMMIPEQENALRTEDGQVRYATALFEGLEAYLRGVGGR